VKKSRIASPVPHPESSVRHLPLVDLLVDTKTELLELALPSGLKVFTTMLEEDRTAISSSPSTGGAGHTPVVDPAYGLTWPVERTDARQ
jgi:hypothetical protein